MCPANPSAGPLALQGLSEVRAKLLIALVELTSPWQGLCVGHTQSFLSGRSSAGFLKSTWVTSNDKDKQSHSSTGRRQEGLSPPTYCLSVSSVRLLDRPVTLATFGRGLIYGYETYSGSFLDRCTDQFISLVNIRAVAQAAAASHDTEPLQAVLLQGRPQLQAEAVHQLLTPSFCCTLGKNPQVQCLCSPQLCMV